MDTRQKTAQLQIRVSPGEKLAIQRAAKSAGMDMSAFVLDRVLPAKNRQFEELTAQLAGAAEPAFALAELNDFLHQCVAAELGAAVASAPAADLSPWALNYVAAMVEYACAGQGLAAPSWTRTVQPLQDPWFGSELQSLRLHLLLNSPAPFRRRNIFIDSTLGSRV